MPALPNRPLSLRQIEVFRALMSSGSVTGAAELLHISVPAVSRMLAHMETRLGYALFERVRGRLKPTQEAKRLYPEMSDLFEHLNRLNELADQLRYGREGRVRIAASPNLGIHLLPQALRRFIQRAPDIHVHFGTLTDEQLIAELLLGSADVGVSFHPIEHPAFISEPICENPMVFACPREHPLADRTSVQLADIVGETLIGFPSKHLHGLVLETLYANQDPPPKPSIEVRFSHLACALVNAGAGVALIDALSVPASVWPDVVAIPVQPRQPSIVSAVYSALEPPPREVRLLIELLKEVAQEAGL